MPIVTIPVTIDKARVLACMGYSSLKLVPAKVLRECSEVISEAAVMLKPLVCYETYPLIIDESNNRLVLPDGNCFSGEYIFQNLASAEQVVVVIATLGNAVSQAIESYFKRGLALKGMILDTIANTVLEQVNHTLWEGLAKQAETGKQGITRRFCPGNGDWELAEQAVLCSLLPLDTLNVRLNERFMMIPAKSVSLVYGIGKAVPMSAVDHDCRDCNQTRCPYPKAHGNYELIIKRQDEVRTITARAGENLLEVLTGNNIYINQACGNNHTCGKCQVYIKCQPVPPISEAEAKLLGPDNLKRGLRLACFLQISSNMIVQIKEQQDMKIVSAGPAFTGEINSSLKKITVTVAPPSLEEPRDDVARLVQALRRPDCTIAYTPLQQLPLLLTAGEGDLSCTLYENEIIALAPADEIRMAGIAMDIGTTTIVAYLIDMESGRELDVETVLNPQRLYGADVITRIAFTQENPAGLAQLHRVLIDGINSLLERLCRRNGLPCQHIYEMMVAGNPTMLHLLLNIPCTAIARAPYTPVFTKGLKIKAQQIGLLLNPEGYISLLPAVSGYVGADIIADMLVCAMHKSSKVSLLLDIGTNGEMVLGNREKLVCCATAAGPAFEGAKISCGTGAVAGAIDHIDFSRYPFYTTIGNKPPVGICGYGLVDLLAELVKYGLVTNSGKLKKRADVKEGAVGPELAESLIVHYGKPAFMIDKETGIYLTQQDIGELQLAKGAIFAGISVLCKKLGCTCNDIDKVYLAGGFGTYLNIAKAIAIKLLPIEFQDKVIFIGNGAGAGAKLALLSQPVRQAAQELSVKLQYVELSASREFTQEFIKGMDFKVQQVVSNRSTMDGQN